MNFLFIIVEISDISLIKVNIFSLFLRRVFPEKAVIHFETVVCYFRHFVTLLFVSGRLVGLM